MEKVGENWRKLEKIGEKDSDKNEKGKIGEMEIRERDRDEKEKIKIGEMEMR